MKHIGFNSRLFFLSALLLVACSPAAATRVAESRPPMVIPSPSIQYAPSPAPSPTPAPTESHDPRTPTLLPQALREATMIARATISPFPTAGAVAIKLGSPASALARRDGLSFAVELPKDSFLEGENGRAQITLRNDGRETLMIYGDGHNPAQVILLDQRGHEPAPYPWFSFPVSAGPPYMRKLAPGQVLTATMNFQLPPSDQATNHNYVLWAWTQFSQLAPDNPDEADSIWLRLETGPILLHLAAPDASQQLIAHLQADRKGWQLRVTDARGQVPNHPLSGALQAATSNILQGRGLEDNAQGEWSAGWDLPMDEARIVVHAWIAAPGYAIAAITQTVPGGDNGRTPLDAPPAPPKVFTSRESAQAALGFPLYAPKTLPPNAALDHVEVETVGFDHNRLTNTTQSYRVGRSGWFELMQENSTEPSAPISRWRRACCNYEAVRVAINGATGYLVKQFDWWILDWRVGEVGFELHAPTQVISREQLLNIAQSVQP